jgi:hypothetical protein
MRYLLDRFNGDYRLALAGYHAGEGDAAAALRNPAGNPKTNAYVNKIMAQAGRGGSILPGIEAESDLTWLIAAGIGVIAFLLLRD